VIELQDATYVYPRTGSGVHDVTLAVPPGSIYALLGPNGAGKTTLMKLTAGLLKPQQGGLKPAPRSGTLIESPSLYEHLTGYEHLCVFAEYEQVARASARPVLERVGLAHAADRRVNQYSLGMKQRLGLATALLHDPPLLILDEPTNGLDPEGIIGMRRLLAELRDAGKTIIVSSHLLAEVEKVATHIAVIDRGRVRFEGAAHELGGSLEDAFLALLGRESDAR